MTYRELLNNISTDGLASIIVDGDLQVIACLEHNAKGGETCFSRIHCKKCISKLLDEEINPSYLKKYKKYL